MGELMQWLEFNCEAMELLANRFLQLVREDCGRVQQMLQRIRSIEKGEKRKGEKGPGSINGSDAQRGAGEGRRKKTRRPST
jgi:hypothetical protein